MPASPFNAMHAAVDPRGVLIRDHLAGVGEAHGRAVMGMALDRLVTLGSAMSAAVLDVVDGEGERMARVYVEAGCSREQLMEFVDGYRRGAAARVAEAMALCAADHQGTR